MSSGCASPSVSVVVASHNEGARLRETVHSLLAGLPADGEIVVVDDVSTDGSAERLTSGYGGVTVLRPPARVGAIEARNLGARAARGAVLVFSDAHIEAPLGWVRPLLAALAQPHVGAVGPAISAIGRPASVGYGFRWRDAAMTVEWLGRQAEEPYPVPMLGAGFLAIRRDTFFATGGFDAGLLLWGCEDAELCLRLWTLGLECIVVPTVDVGHFFRPAHPYRIHWDVVLHNMLRVGVVHFGTDRLRRLVERLTPNRSFPTAFARLASGDAWDRRRAMRAARRFDDEWFFTRFCMTAH